MNNKKVVYKKLNADELFYVGASRGGTDAAKGCALLQLTVVTGEAPTTPHQLTLSIHPEIAKKVISDLQASLERLGSIQ